MYSMIEIGSVFKMRTYPEDGITPKDGYANRIKILVVLGKNEEFLTVATVIINSGINAHKFNKIAPYQHEIRREDYTFLTKEKSYVDGYSLKEFTIDRVRDEAEYLGKINDEDLAYIVEKVKSSPSIKQYIIKRYNL